MSSLVCAVERARIIETSSKNIYELETKKLNLIYSKMEDLLKNSETKGSESKREELLKLIEDCRNSLQDNIKAQRENIRESVSSDPIKKLLSKMLNQNKNQNLTEKTEQNQTIADKNVVLEKNSNEEISKTNLEDVKSKNLVAGNLSKTLSYEDSSFKFDESSDQNNNLQFEKKAKNQNVKMGVSSRHRKPKKREEKLKPDLAEFDKFLSKETISNGENFENIMFSRKRKDDAQKENNSFGEKQNYSTKNENASNNINPNNAINKLDLTPNESGFDLKEAINPKDDLEEIMKAFDFFNDNKKKVS